MIRSGDEFRSSCRRALQVVILLAQWPSLAVAQQELCDPGLPIAEGNPLHYQLRGSATTQTDRCEGLFVQEVGSSTLSIASLTTYVEDFDLDSGQPLQIEWSPPGDEPFKLRARGLRHKLYYRMDTVRPANTRAYSWPLDVLSALKVRRRDLGVLGWIRTRVGELDRNVYLPVRVQQGGKPSPPASYELVVVPGRELTEVFVSLASVGENGRPDVFLREGVPLEYGYYPSAQAIRIPIPELDAKGFYFIEIGVTTSSGRPAAAALWFYHTGD